jgi:hypothetical protein
MSSISLNGASPTLLYPLLAGASNDPLLAGNTQAVPELGGPNASAYQQSLTPAAAGQANRPSAALFQQVQQAVTGALQSAQGNSSADPNQIVEQAITSVIQQALSSASTSGAADSDDGAPSTDTAASANQSGIQAFFQELQANGVNPQQFRSDFLSAVQQSQQGTNVDPGTVFGSFPTGLSVDTAA